MTTPTTNTLGMIYPRVEGRIPADAEPWSGIQVYHRVKAELLDRPWLQYMIHQPAGWHGSMTGAQWFPMGVPHREAYAAAIAEALAERPGLKGPWIYGGLQLYTAYSNHGDPEKRWDEHAPWADPSNPVHVRGVVATVLPWVDRGVTGWVFDSGSRRPEWVVKWQDILRRETGIQVVGLETIPWEAIAGGIVVNRVDWRWAMPHGIHYHGNLRVHGGRPFRETVPDGVHAYAWIRHEPFPSVDEIRAMIERGWTMAPDAVHDDVVQQAQAVPDVEPDGVDRRSGVDRRKVTVNITSSDVDQDVGA